MSSIVRRHARRSRRTVRVSRQNTVTGTCKPEYQLGETGDGSKQQRVLPWFLRNRIMRRIVISLPLAAVASLLVPYTVGAQLVQPAGIILKPSQQQQFSLNLNGQPLAATWKASPRGIGSITSSGLYTAPSVVSANSTVTMVATNAGINYSTSIQLAPGTATASTTGTTSGSTSTSKVSVSLSPASVTLTPGKRQRFTASLAGTTNTSVTWSVAPQVGSIFQGTYTAPSTITAAMTVVVTATSAADPTALGTATVYLQPTGSTSSSIFRHYVRHYFRH